MNKRFSNVALLIGLFCMLGMTACAIKPGDMRGKSVEWIDKTMQKREKLKMPVQQAAVQELAKIGDENALQLLIDLSEDKDPTLRGEVALALGRVDNRDALVRLIQMLGDSDSAVRRKASSALQRQLDNAADASVAERMMREADINRDFRIRLECMRLITSFEPEGLAELLIRRAAKDESAEVRRAAAKSLGMMADRLSAPQKKAAHETLNKLKHADLDSSVRAAASDAVEKINYRVVRTVGVVGLENRTGIAGFDQFCEDVADIISASLARERLATVVERRQLGTVLNEMALQQMLGIDNPDQAVELGKLLQADEIVFGTLQGDGNQVTVIVKRVDVISGVLLQGVNISGYALDLEQLKQSVARKVVVTYR